MSQKTIHIKVEIKICIQKKWKGALFTAAAIILGTVVKVWLESGGIL